MVPEDLFERSPDARFERRRAFAAGHDVPIRLFDPRRPLRRKSLGDLLGAQALPFAEVDLAQGGERLGFGSDVRGDRLRRLGGASQIARVEAGELATRQPRAEPLGLAQAFRGKWGVELALDAVLAIPRR